MTNQRRRSRRYPTDWAARFRFDAAAAWRTCRLIDVSWDGAALELYGVGDDEPLTGPMDVDITPVTGSDDGILLRGSIRHRARTAIGRVIVGIEFRRLSADEMQVLRLLVSVRAAV
jgi:PilZ domain